MIPVSLTVDLSTLATRFIFDNEDILLEIDGSNNITARYTHGPGIDEPLILEKGGASFFYHADGLGSITEITNSSGTVVQAYTYSSFGKIESQLDSTFIQPYTFTSREFDPETSLYFYRARTYDPSAGRFLQEDPLRGFTSLPQSLNRYLYVGNTPLTYTDPVGLINLLVGSGFSAVVGGGVEGAAGVIINPGLGREQADIGVFGSVGAGFPGQPGGGINVSAEYLFFGYITGDPKGWTTNYNYAFGPISVTVFTDPVTGEKLGGTIGFGPIFWPIPLGASVTQSHTDIRTVRDLLKFVSRDKDSRSRSLQLCR